MCSKLTETAADDLLAFVRRARRYAVEAQTHGGHERALDTLGEDARRLLDKHGLLTMADDPEVARVFTEDKPAPDYNSGEAHLRAFEHRYGITAGSPARFADGPHPISCVSPARMSYAESEWCSWCGRMTDHRSGFHFSDAEGFREGERVTLDCVGGLATDPRLDPGTPAEGQRIAHGAQGVVDCAGTHNVGVVWDGYEGSVRVPASMLRRW